MAAFTGISTNKPEQTVNFYKEFDKALENAIELAKKSLQTDYVEWTLGEIGGKDGGFAQVHEISVTIKAHPMHGK